MKHIFLAACIICLSISTSQAQVTKSNEEKNHSKESLQIKIKDDVKPDIYINGKKYDFEILELLDADKIESMEVIKDEQAIKKYDAPNGVILITAKKKSDLKVQSTNSQIIIKGTGSIDATVPMVIIDGKVSSKEDLEKLSPDKIWSIDVLKGEKAMEKYNSKSGVIIIKSKKGKKEDKNNKK